MKYIFSITQQCNLRCKYCYIDKQESLMPLPLAKKIVNFMYKRTPPEEKIRAGFFGGEPLMAFELIKDITAMIEDHPLFDRERVEIAVVSNGTIFSDEIAEFMKQHDVGFCVSCDGPAFVHDMFRCFPNAKGSSALVERTIREAQKHLPCVPVNAVYHPQTFKYLPQVVEYFSSLGISQIYLSPEFSAKWTKEELEFLPEVYDQIGEQYMNYYREHKPHFISLIDSKIIVILRGGYQPLERCRMGIGEYAFTPSGNIYPCERLIGSDDGNGHCIGNVHTGFNVDRMICKNAPGGEMNTSCVTCGIREYCMNWCGCSNYFASGYYNRVSPFLCASERESIRVAFRIFQTLEQELGPTFIDHVTGLPVVTSFGKEVK
jgi:uncharacterized protein